MSIKMILEAINDVFETDKKPYRASIHEDYKHGKKVQGIQLKNTTNDDGIKAYPVVWLNGKEKEEDIYSIVKMLENAINDNPYKDFTINKEYVLANVEKELVPDTYIKESEEKHYIYERFHKTDTIVRYIVLMNDGLFRVSKDIIEKFGISISELDESSSKNMKQSLIIKTLGDILFDCVDIDTPDFSDEAEDFMFVVTNRDKRYGSGQIANFETLIKIQNTICYDEFYILPSSKHEVIVIPKLDNRDPQYLKDMVYTINSTEVDEKDFLSNQVLLVDADCNIYIV